MAPTNLESLSKEELILLLKQFHEKTEDDEKPYHPDSVMAFALASPKEARAISMRMMPLASKIILTIAVCIALLGVLVVVSV